MKMLPWILTSAVAMTAQAHDGHGLSGGHWHATDAFGFVALVALLAAVVWWRGRK